MKVLVNGFHLNGHTLGLSRDFYQVKLIFDSSNETAKIRRGNVFKNVQISCTKQLPEFVFKDIFFAEVIEKAIKSFSFFSD